MQKIQIQIKFHIRDFQHFLTISYSDLVKQSQPHNLSIYVSNDQMLYLDEIRNLCETGKKNTKFQLPPTYPQLT